MALREIVASNLRRLRHSKGLSQEELAHRADIDRTYVSSFERCVYGVSIDMLERLARVLGIEVPRLFMPDNNVIEQDHRFIKKRTRPMKGFKSFQSASATLDGIEVAHMIRNQQFPTSGQSAFQQFAALAA